jgi:hypothetical protein
LNEQARRAATDLVAGDPDLTRAEHAGLRRVLGERYQRAMELFHVA